MNLSFVTNLSIESFNRFVENHESGSFLQSTDWGEWMRENKKDSYRFAVADSEKNILLACQILETPIPKIGGTYLYIPYGPVTVSSDPEILNFFLAEIKKQFPQSVFLRIEPKQNLSFKGVSTKHIQPGKTLILDLTKTEDELLTEMHQKTRYNIKVAKRHGVEVKVGNGQKAIELINETSSRQGYKNHPLSYYQNLVEFFNSGERSLNLKVYYAEHQNQILASAIILDFGATRTYLFGGTSEEHRNTMAPYLLHWQAILDAKESGFKHYDFWGIETASGATPGFVKFKLGWGGTQVQYPATTDIVYKKIKYSAYKFLRSLNKKLKQ